MGFYDYLVIVFYFAFMLALGPIYKSFSRTASDYFRGGGGMLWWVVGSSAFMTTFSAWSFTGGAAKTYETGTFFLLLFGCNFASLFVTYFFTAARFRQMRIITAIEGVQKRFGFTNEQVFAWINIPFNVIFGGLGLYTISLFMYSVFGIQLEVMIITLGVVVMIMTLLGGSWAATAGDFVQMLVLLTITVLLAFLTLDHPEVGGVRGLIDNVPSHLFNWTEFARPSVIISFAITLLINQTVQNNSILQGAAKYVFVKDGRDARKAVLLSMAGFLLLSPVWLIPPMAATILHPNLGAEYPDLGNQANSAAYVAMAIDLLPTGLLGVMVCGIFAASVTSLNSALNTWSGTFVRNFWIRVVDPGATEERQILIGRIFIFCYAALWVVVALVLTQYKDIPLFDMLLILAASLNIPATVPMFFGIFVKRTPSWSGWSTLAVGFTFSIALRILFAMVPAVDFFNGLLSPEVPFTEREAGDLNIGFTTAVLFFVTIGWFFMTMLFYNEEEPEYKAEVDKFFDEMDTPIDHSVEHGPSYDNDRRQNNVMATLCLVYGAVMGLLILIPNRMMDRWGIVFCAGTIFIVGVILKFIARKSPRVCR